MTLEELLAREAIRETIASYNYFGDAGRGVELSELFVADGVLEVVGTGVFQGREAIAEFVGDVSDRNASAAAITDQASQPLMVRHHLSTLMFVSLGADEARVRTYFAMMTRDGMDHTGKYIDVLVPEDGQWRFRHRTVRVEAFLAGGLHETWAAEQP